VVLTFTRSERFHPFSLDALNFLLADVRGALGPYLNVFLVTQRHWSQSEVGLVTTIGGLLGLAVQTPIGAAIDETRAKRGAIVLAVAVLGVGAVPIFAWPSFWPVVIANSLMAIVGDVFGPTVAALTLGLYARKQLARRMGRNSAFDHAGKRRCRTTSWPSPLADRRRPAFARPTARTIGDAADRIVGRKHRRQLGAEALVPGRVRHPAGPGQRFISSPTTAFG
jgi:hypothetical protein